MSVKNYILEVKHPKGNEYSQKCTFAAKDKAVLVGLRGENEQDVRNAYITEPKKYLKVCDVCGEALIRITSIRPATAY